MTGPILIGEVYEAKKDHEQRQNVTPGVYSTGDDESKIDAVCEKADGCGVERLSIDKVIIGKVLGGIAFPFILSDWEVKRIYEASRDGKQNEEAEKIRAEHASGLSKLYQLKTEMDNLSFMITNLETVAGIPELRKQLGEKQTEYEANMKEVAETVTFGSDRFMEAKGQRGDSFKAGTLKLVRHITERREVITKKFVEKYKDLALKICTIPVGKAETLLGSEVNQFCKKKVSYKFELVDLSVPQLDQDEEGDLE